MKTISVFTRLTTTVLCCTLLMVSCKKDTSSALSNQEEEQAVQYTTEAEAESQFIFDDVTDNVLGVNDDVGIGGIGVFGRTAASHERVAKVDSMPRCVTVSITPLQRGIFPKTVVINFGNGCTVKGHTRSGKITTVYTGRLIDPGKSATTTFENFTIDSVSVAGTHKITNSTVVGGNQRQFTIDVTNAKLSRPGGNYTEWNSIRTHTQIEGNGTVRPSDDVIQVTGKSAGTTNRSNLLVSWSSEITEPLIKRFTCRWISKGIIKTERNGLQSNSPWVSSLDFGDGNCDKKASLTVNGNVYQITLK